MSSSPAAASLGTGTTGTSSETSPNPQNQQPPQRHAPVIPKKSSEIRVFKIIAIGDSGVGKTCLTYRFCSGKFPVKTEVTIGVDFREKCVEIEGEIIKLQLWDTAGQERFRKSMIQHYYRNVNAVVFVYDVTAPGSFEALPTWIMECEKHNLTRDHVPRILIGNKLDCGTQAVPTNTAQKFADMHNMPLFETSALADSHADHVESIFLTIAHKLKASKPMMVGTNEGAQGVQLHHAEPHDPSNPNNLEDSNNGSACAC